MEQPCFLKVEAVNIYNTILDTTQLSVIRGGSYLLKQTIEDIHKLFNDTFNKDEYIPLTIGGSIGIFAIASDKLAQAQDIIKECLNKKSPTVTLSDIFTFTVDEVKADNYLIAKELLTARGRQQQARQLSFGIPQTLADAKSGNKKDKTGTVCALNGVLPADNTSITIPAAGNNKVSQSVASRFLQGRDMKFSIYKKERDALLNEKDNFPQLKLPLGSEKIEQQQFEDYIFASDLETLAGQHHKIALNGKVAVIYTDGNGFGKAQKEYIKTASNQEKAQQEFDVALRLWRSTYLVKLAQFLIDNNAIIDSQTDPATATKTDNQAKTIVQLETLQWGGDEMTIVVPAWIGMRVLAHFFDFFKNFNPGNADQPLTFAAGIVFCSHKTPIQKAQDAAQNLADAIKDQPDKRGRKHNLFDYMVLESIDYPTQTLKDFWHAQYGSLAQYRQPMTFTDPASFQQPASASQEMALNDCLKALPRSSIYKLVELAIQLRQDCIPSHNDNATRLDKWEQKGSAAQLAQHLHRIQNYQHPESEQAITRLTNLLQTFIDPNPQEQPFSENLTTMDQRNPLFWLHLLELYDFLDPEAPKESVQNRSQQPDSSATQEIPA
ncbi:Cas10/Cmr2 second palm domain-containing protein [Vibrio spartinae]|uniref:Cas10/Cmr2 second palm domain-containing protein n=1 Tax=Vibrio spartinae TaxID=1918945 RepID=A0ABX6R3Y4_9VIBR|nr:hypothetical protein [Vibrio spartinae]QMV16214.1 hypothetical protein Vspart_03599 [Vibrio spartinae]